MLNFGRVIAVGTPAEVQANTDVHEAYLGKHFGRMILEVRIFPSPYGPSERCATSHFSVAEGELVSVVGPTARAKAPVALFVGIVRAREAKSYSRANITRAAPHPRIEQGLVQVPEGRAILQNMSVLENLIIAFEHGRDKRPRDAAIAEALELFPILRERRDQRAGTMSGGEQQMLALARGLAANPELACSTSPRSGLRR